MIVIQVLIAWLLADFITGIVHWYEERYMQGPYKWAWLQNMYEDNREHHIKPTKMCQYTWWENIRFSFYFAAPAALVIAVTGGATWLWLAVLFASLGNLVHRWAHEPYGGLPLWIKAGQFTGLFITKRHHDTHHRHDGHLIPKEDSTIAYCPMTNWVNPVLDTIRFWDGLEWIIKKTLGIKPLTRSSTTTTA